MATETWPSWVASHNRRALTTDACSNVNGDVRVRRKRGTVGGEEEAMSDCTGSDGEWYRAGDTSSRAHQAPWLKYLPPVTPPGACFRRTKLWPCKSLGACTNTRCRGRPAARPRIGSLLSYRGHLLSCGLTTQSNSLMTSARTAVRSIMRSNAAGERRVIEASHITVQCRVVDCRHSAPATTTSH